MTEPLVLTTAPELERLIRKAVAEEAGGRSAVDEKPVSAKQAAKHFGMDDQRLRDWCEHGCDVCGEKMPSMTTSDVRGLKIYLSEAREWLQTHRAPGGCRG